MTQLLTVDDLTFEVRRSSRRRTLEIIVDRGGELVIAAPDSVGDEVLEAFVKEKRFWLYRLRPEHALDVPVMSAESGSVAG